MISFKMKDEIEGMYNEGLKALLHLQWNWRMYSKGKLYSLREVMYIKNLGSCPVHALVSCMVPNILIRLTIHAMYSALYLCILLFFHLSKMYNTCDDIVMLENIENHNAWKCVLSMGACAAKAHPWPIAWAPRAGEGWWEVGWAAAGEAVAGWGGGRGGG